MIQLYVYNGYMRTKYNLNKGDCIMVSNEESSIMTEENGKDLFYLFSEEVVKHNLTFQDSHVMNHEKKNYIQYMERLGVRINVPMNRVAIREKNGDDDENLTYFGKIVKSKGVEFFYFPNNWNELLDETFSMFMLKMENVNRKKKKFGELVNEILTSAGATTREVACYWDNIQEKRKLTPMNFMNYLNYIDDVFEDIHKRDVLEHALECNSVEELDALRLEFLPKDLELSKGIIKSYLECR